MRRARWKLTREGLGSRVEIISAPGTAFHVGGVRLLRVPPRTDDTRLAATTLRQAALFLAHDPEVEWQQLCSFSRGIIMSASIIVM